MAYRQGELAKAGSPRKDLRRDETNLFSPTTPPCCHPPCLDSNGARDSDAPLKMPIVNFITRLRNFMTLPNTDMGAHELPLDKPGTAAGEVAKADPHQHRLARPHVTTVPLDLLDMLLTATMKLHDQASSTWRQTTGGQQIQRAQYSDAACWPARPRSRIQSPGKH